MAKRKADRTKRNRPARRRDGRAGLQTRYTLGRRYPSALAEGPAGASWKSPAKPVPPFLSLSLDSSRIPRDRESHQFEFVADVQDLEALPERCAMFSRILWWKTVTLQTAYVASMLTLVAAAILLFAIRI